MKVLISLLVIFLLFGCSYVLTKNKNDGTLPSANTFPPGENQYLRYFNFQHANSSTREAQLELILENETRDIQALLLPGESFSFSQCGGELVTRFDGFMEEGVYNDVIVTLTRNGKSEKFNLSRNDHSVLQISCQGISKITRLFDTRKEAHMVIVGPKTFILENDTMTDTWCAARSITPNGPIQSIRHQDWYSLNYDTTPLRRYMFRPNTFICDENTDYFLEEDLEFSKQCFTHLGKRNPTAAGCKNLEGLLGNPDLE